MCTKNASSGLICVQCGAMSHFGCVSLMKNVKMINESEKMIVCCDSSNEPEMTFECSDIDKISTDGMKEIIYLKSLVEHKDIIITQQQDNTESLTAQIKLPNLWLEKHSMPSAGEDQKLTIQQKPLVEKETLTKHKNNESIVNNHFLSLNAHSPSNPSGQALINRTDQGPRNLAAPSTSEVATRTEKIHQQFRSNNNKRTYQNKKDESDRKFVSSKQVNAAILEAKTNSTIRNSQHLDNQEVPGNDGWTQVKYNKKHKYLVGQSEQVGEIETVPKMVTFHVTRLKPNTKLNELKKFLEKVFLLFNANPTLQKDLTFILQ
ncbi:hypothetical protein JTB14_019467 [Gonioctena quinquepunctata]|nr:hypothetical protein JTB14_019467 [Gonioctena quinquepunctata]